MDRAARDQYLTLGLVIIILLLLSVIFSGSYYLFTTIKEMKLQIMALQDTFNTTGSSINPEANLTPVPSVPPLQTVKSQDQSFEISLDQVTLGKSIVTINFTAKNISDRMQTLVDNSDDLAKSYLTDEASSLKYEVVKDSSGKPLVSEINNKWLTVGERYSFYIQFTAPTKGSTVNINIPNIMPILGIKVD